MGLTDLLLGRTEHRAASLSDVLAGGGWAAGVQADRKEWWTDGDERELTTSAIVGRCITAIAQPLSSIDLVALVETDEGEEADARDPFARIFNKGGVGQQVSARITKEVAFSRLEWRGSAFLHLDRGDAGTGPVRSIMPIYRTCKPVVDRDRDTGAETLLGYRVAKPNGGWLGLLPSEVLWLRYPDPDDPWGSIAPWSRAKFAARLDRKGQKWMDEELTNGNRSASVVHLGDLDSEEYQRSVAAWNRTMKGPRSNGRAFLTAGPVPASVQRLGMTVKEAAYLDTRRYNAEEVALAFGIDRDYLFGESTYENKAAARVGLWQDTLTPKLEVIASEVDRQIYPDDTRSAGWDVSNVQALQESDTTVVERITALLERDAITIDEARGERGLEPLPEGIGQLTLSAYRKMVEVGPVDESGTAAAASSPFSSVGLPALIAAGVIDEDEGRKLLGLSGKAPGAPGTRSRLRVVTRSGLVTARRHRTPAPAPTVPSTRALAPRDEAAVQRVYDRQEARGERVLTRFAEVQERAVLARFKKAQQRAARGGVEQRAGVDEFYDGAYWRDRLADAVQAWMADVWEEGGQRTASSLGLDFEQYNPAVTAAMEARTLALAEQVTATTRAVIESDVLAKAAEQGLSVDDTTTLLRQKFTDLATWRGRAIARTETVGGFNAASRAVAATSGVVQRRRWLAASDDRVRDSHARMNGHTTLGMDDPYPNGLMHPGDPSGPPAETVQCRCVEIYVTEDQQ